MCDRSIRATTVVGKSASVPLSRLHAVQFKNSPKLCVINVSFCFFIYAAMPPLAVFVLGVYLWYCIYLHPVPLQYT